MIDDIRDRYRKDYRSIHIPKRPLSPRTSLTIDQIPAQQSYNRNNKDISSTISSTSISSPPMQHRVVTHSKPLQGASERVSSKFQSQAQPIKKHRLNRSKKGHFKKLLVVPLIILLLFGLAFGGWISYLQFKPSPIPKNFVQLSDFPLYYPSKLPYGYYVDSSTFDTQSNAFVFTVKNSKDSFKSVAISEQKQPTNFNINNQFPDNSSGKTPDKRTFSTSIGKAQVGTWQDRLVGSISADNQTWIIVNISTVPSSDADAIMQSFKSIDKPSPLQELHDLAHKLKSLEGVIK